MISGLSHITFITNDLEEMSRAIIEVLGGEEIYDSGGRQFSISREKFFTIGNIWIAVMEGESLPSRSYNHVAFITDDAGLEKARVAVEKLGLEIKPSRSRVEGEGHSLYFYTPDNHLIELHTGTLNERLAHYTRG
ncbi:MAG: FosX/FosE/FosI family fosfomycin resistance hydrolase [Pseudomonadota bacterium]|nr:FosX/FosE/FosI family fosfomycin resistance hydrolase [Pseudomonadota bacterium]